MKILAPLLLLVTVVSPLRSQEIRLRMRPTVAVQLTVKDVDAADSTAILDALVTGLQADSAVEILARPTVVDGRPVRAATYYVTATVQMTRGSLVLGFRSFHVGTAEVVSRANAFGSATVLGDSARVIGRRIARDIAANSR
jgi:hypothetical protein